MMLLQLNHLGYNVTDSEGFLIDRPKGCGDYLFLHFKTTIHIKIDGTLIKAAPNSCILFSPDYPQWFHSPDCELMTNWFHFTGESDPMIKLFERLDLPINTIFHPASLVYLDLIFQAIRNELIIEEHYGSEFINGLLIQFLAKLARSVRQKPETPISSYKRASLEKFKSIRLEMLNSPERVWTVAKMAEIAHLSETRFSTLYKDFFRVSPKQDLIRIRLEKAQYLLMNKAVTVQEVADQTGYDSTFHFIRQFKKYVGCTPGKYYNYKD